MSPIARSLAAAALGGACVFLSSCASSPPPIDWKPVAGGMCTAFAATVDPYLPRPEYPRPQLVRQSWTNLNGMWRYAITAGDGAAPSKWAGEILVPFPLESALSGVGEKLAPDRVLWYRREFKAPAGAAGSRLLLQFGAVDWHAVVFVNGTRVGEHRGGFDPFAFDITDALRPDPDGEAVQELLVRVADPTNAGDQPVGTQALEPGGRLHTRVSGIWQTVWLERVPAVRIEEVLIAPREELDGVIATVRVRGGETTPRVRLRMLREERVAARAEGLAGEKLLLKVGSPHPWSPESPTLYDLWVEIEGGETVKSYCAIRTIGMGKDERGVARMLLNGRAYFPHGVLDQGRWPDGLFTAPTEAALRADIEAAKRMGFTLIRKYAKVEPACWYYWCDRLGILVWQDIPGGANASEEGRVQFHAETLRSIDALRPFPSIVMWVLFNEGRGQEAYGVPASCDLAAEVGERDPTRLVDGASGWIDTGNGDVRDMHFRPGPGMHPLQPARVNVLGEYGGLERVVEGRTWAPRAAVKDLPGEDPLRGAYRELAWQLHLLHGQGLGGAVYAQLTDVEDELDGLRTYDRRVEKLSEAWLEAVNARLTQGPPPEVMLLAGGAEPWRLATAASAAALPEATDTTAWPQDCGPFGASLRNVATTTPWTSGALRLVRRFQCTLEADEYYVCGWALRGAALSVTLNGTALTELGELRGERRRCVPVKRLLDRDRNLLLVTAVRDSSDAEQADAAFDVRLIGVRRARLAPAAFTPLVPTAAEGQAREAAIAWRYATTAPAAGWTDAFFDDSAWLKGRGGFGAASAKGAVLGTPWTTGEIWLRGKFTLDRVPAGACLVIRHGGDAEVCVNGIAAARLPGASGAYVTVPIVAPATLRAGDNLITIHCRGAGAEQFIDAGVAVESSP